MQTPLNINSRMEREMWRLHIFWQATIPDMACRPGHIWNNGTSQVPLFNKSITDRLVVIQREEQDVSKGK